MWHVNPENNHTSVCVAKSIESCPLYQRNKETKHFTTHDEAKAYVNEQEKQRNGILANSESNENYDNIKYLFSKHHKTVDGLDEYERRELVQSTKDESLLRDIFNKKILDTDDSRFVDLAIQNPHLPQRIKEHMISNPDAYVNDRIYALINSEHITNVELTDISQNTSNEDIEQYVEDRALFIDLNEDSFFPEELKRDMIENPDGHTEYRLYSLINSDKLSISDYMAMAYNTENKELQKYIEDYKIFEDFDDY